MALCFSPDREERLTYYMPIPTWCKMFSKSSHCLHRLLSICVMYLVLWGRPLRHVSCWTCVEKWEASIKHVQLQKPLMLCVSSFALPAAHPLYRICLIPGAMLKISESLNYGIGTAVNTSLDYSQADSSKPSVQSINPSHCLSSS